MATPLANAQTLGLQLEKVRDKVPLWYQRDDTLFGMLEKRGDVEIVSTRNMRIPIQVLAGGKFSQVTMDGGDLGRGSGTTFDVAQVTPVYFAQATEITKLVEYATDSKEKSVENVAKREVQNSIDQLRTNLEALLNTDGSGTLDTIVSGSSGSAVITVNNANQFYDNQDLLIYSALGGTNRGTVTILSVDANGKTITLTANAPSGTTAGDLLLPAGSSATAASSLFGLQYHQVDSNTGTWLQISRSTYPGKVKTPHVAAGSQSLSPAMVRLAKQLVRRALGVNAPDLDGLIFHANLDQESAWENTGLIVASVIQNQLTGSNSQDMIKKAPAKTMAGHPFVASIHAKPGRIDGLCLKHWGRAETKEIDYYEVGGQTVFPVYGGSGGVATSQIFYFVTGLQIFTDNPRAGVFIDGLASPTGY